MRLTAKERILIHLAEFAKYAERAEVSPQMGQEGIAQAVGIHVQHVRQFIDPLERDGLLKERTAHVTGHRRRLKVYDLTDSGRMAAGRLRERVQSEPVQVRGNEGIRETTIEAVLRETEGRATLADLMRETAEREVVDLDLFANRAGSAFVERLSDAPRVGVFVGRTEELAALIDSGSREPIVVVLGVAGIGKSTLAAKACESLRGTRNLFWHRVRPWDSESALLGSLADFLATIGRPGLRSVVARGEAARAHEVLRADLPGSKAVLVFDDVHEAPGPAERFLRQLKEALSPAAEVRVVVLARARVPFYDRRDVSIERQVREINLGGLRPDEMRSLLPALDVDAEPILKSVGGHPLFAALLRANPSRPGLALRDFRRFLAEEVYTKLSDPQRRIMKVASLYRVPVPQDALFLDPTTSYDHLIGLTELALLRTVGEAEYDVHDSIREFFEELLTESERKEIGIFAARQLRVLAGRSRDREDHIAWIQELSNALRLSVGLPDEPRLAEDLGDALESIGDLPDALAAYRDALRGSSEAEDRARLHRKAASAFEERGDISSARREIDAGLEALGGASLPERGWLQAIRSAIARYADEYVEAREYGEEALRVFREFRDTKGEARALLELGSTGYLSPKGDDAVAERLLTEALEKANSVGDPVLQGSIHMALADLYAYVGRIDECLSHLSAADRVSDPHVRRSVLEMRGWVLASFKGDFDGADAAFRAAMGLSREIHDPSTVGMTKYGLAIVLYHRGRFAEALTAFEGAATELGSMGFLSVSIEVLSLAAHCALIEGDIRAFRKIKKALDDPRLSHVDVERSWRSVIDGLAHQLEGDDGACDEAFGMALETRKMPQTMISHLLYGAALLARGKENDAERHLEEARELARRFGRSPYLNTTDDVVRRIAAALRKGRAKRNRRTNRGEG